MMHGLVKHIIFGKVLKIQIFGEKFLKELQENMMFINL